MKRTSCKSGQIGLQPLSGQRMVALLSELATSDGFLTSRLPGVDFMRASQRIHRRPISYEPGIFIVAQGRKTGYFGHRKIIYDADNYLVLSVPMPFECETEGTAETPLLAVRIQVTPAAVTELLMQMEHRPTANDSEPQAMQATALDERLRDATVRLLESLRSADDARILGQQVVREIIYHVLRGKLGKNLRPLAVPDSHFGRIGRVLNRLHANYAHPHDVGSLAHDAGMSIAVFHARFKAVTASSPVQYLKNIRLNKAWMLMVNDGLNASEAAIKVGYESASQFSREFKRLFGDGPTRTVVAARRSLSQAL